MKNKNIIKIKYSIPLSELRPVEPYENLTFEDGFLLEYEFNSQNERKLFTVNSKKAHKNITDLRDRIEIARKELSNGILNDEKIIKGIFEWRKNSTIDDNILYAQCKIDDELIELGRFYVDFRKLKVQNHLRYTFDQMPIELQKEKVYPLIIDFRMRHKEVLDIENLNTKNLIEKLTHYGLA